MPTLPEDSSTFPIELEGYNCANELMAVVAVDVVVVTVEVVVVVVSSPWVVSVFLLIIDSCYDQFDHWFSNGFHSNPFTKSWNVS